MMFHGAYTSEFYREVRNLLHEQVSRGMNADESRWQQLVSREREYRSADRAATAAG
jgi:anaerobic magnesium-protoporphyrin IX monomethyl ester cyclase